MKGGLRGLGRIAAPNTSARLHLPWTVRRISWLITAVSVAYAVAVAVWQILRLTAGDRWWWLAAANVLSLYLFLPLGILLPLAWFSRGRVALVATAVPATIFLALYGGLALPRLGPVPKDGPGTLKVMTLNVLYTNDDGAAIERLVRAASPDLICLQELNPRLAEDLVARLEGAYPYYALLPEQDVTGLGVFSRYPLREEGEIPDPAWRHGAQVMTVEFEGQPILMLNIHALSPSWPRPSRRWLSAFEGEFRAREAEIRLWLDRVRQHDGPVIVAGDLNSTDQNATYGWLAAQLEDAHRQAGWGLGHTAPASRAGLDGAPSPSRLFRLDYVWYSADWQALQASVGEWGGQSDHLPVVASLRLRTQ